MDTELKKSAPNPDDGKDKAKKPERGSSPRWKRIQSAIVLALVSEFVLAGCGVIESRAKANIEAAGVPPAVANDPDLVWAAESGATAEELLDISRSLMQKDRVEANQAREAQAAIDAKEAMARVAAEKQATQQNETAPAPGPEFPLERVADGVYSFSAEENLEVTDPAFLDRIRRSIGKMTGSETSRAYIAVKDDDSGIEEIFMDSTFESFKKVNGAFYAYIWDTVYVSEDLSALKQFLDSQGIKNHTFGLP